MLKRIIFLFFGFFLLAILQISFFSHFSILGQIPNLILSVLFLLVFFEKADETFLLPGIFFAGFFSDIFSSRLLGISILILGLDVLLMKKVLKNVKKQNVLVFIFLFLLFAIFYQGLLVVIDNIMNGFGFFSLPEFFAQIGYTMFFTILQFILCLNFASQKS